MSDAVNDTSGEAALVPVDQSGLEVAQADLELSQANPVGMRRRWSQRGQRGMTTAEYAVGTIASVTFAGVLITIFKDPTVFKALLDLILWVLRQFVG